MDATYGDLISLRFTHLKYVEASIGLSNNFKFQEDTDSFKQFLFTKETGGLLQFPFPLNAFIVISHTTYGLDK